MERSKCNNCPRKAKARTWVGVPFRLYTSVKSVGVDCVSGPLLIGEECGLAYRRLYDVVYKVEMFKLFRRDQKTFLRKLVDVLPSQFTIHRRVDSLLCGDFLFRVIGRAREMFCALFVGDLFYVVRPNIGVSEVREFDYDYCIRGPHSGCVFGV